MHILDSFLFFLFCFFCKSWTFLFEFPAKFCVEPPIVQLDRRLGGQKNKICQDTIRHPEFQNVQILCLFLRHSLKNHPSKTNPQEPQDAPGIIDCGGCLKLFESNSVHHVAANSHLSARQQAIVCVDRSFSSACQRSGDHLPPLARARVALCARDHCQRMHHRRARCPSHTYREQAER